MSTKKILKEREKTHGDFNQTALVAQQLKEIIRSRAEYEGGYTLEPRIHEALDMILHKVARIVCGSYRHKDHWDDIAGYAKLATKFIDSQDKEWDRTYPEDF